jgi:hypothetical protein
MNEWKKKYKVEKGTKVFICDPKYPDVRDSLLARGWVENKDYISHCFDLKWNFKAKDCDFNSLQDHQLLNHFPSTSTVTTKVGLTHSLRNL